MHSRWNLKGEWVIGRVEKGLELVTNVQKFWLHIKGDTLCDHIAHNIFNTLVCESYYRGQQLEFLTLTKPEISKTYAFLTLATKEVRDSILEYGLLNNHKKLKV